MSFLPDNYEKTQTSKNYWKPSKMQDGENRLRIVSKPIAGFIDWIDNKPVRYKPDQKPSKPHDASKPIKTFWAMYVWDYFRGDLFILELTQGSLIYKLTNYAKSADWGDFTKYDLIVTKQGNGLEAKYDLLACPPKPLDPKIEHSLKYKPVRLEALYEGGDPWTDLVAKEVSVADDFSSPSPISKDTLVPVIAEKINRVIDGARIAQNAATKWNVQFWTHGSTEQLQKLEVHLDAMIRDGKVKPEVEEEEMPF